MCGSDRSVFKATVVSSGVKRDLSTKRSCLRMTGAEHSNGNGARLALVCRVLPGFNFLAGVATALLAAWDSL